ncbi:MAG: hypothetical protein EXR49_00325 [Dehalococcoidia bacterium]|nr:hypothetical protein [Dehalococcoidia bacterium]
MAAPPPNASPLCLAIDLGSSSVKCVVVDRRGRSIGHASSAWRPLSPPDVAPYGTEYPPQRSWRLIARTVRHAMADAGVRGAAIAAVAVTSQREGIALLGAEGDTLYLGPNTDARAFLSGQALDDAHGDAVYRTTGHAPSFLFAPAKLAWFRDNRPDIFVRVRHVLPLDAWAAWMLTGVLAVERAAAAEIGLLDIAANDWATGLLPRLGVPASLLPPLVDAGRRIGGVTPAAARATGLATGTPVIAAGPDTQCGLLGMGVTTPGQVGIVAGWSAPLQAVVSSYTLDASARTWGSRHLLPSRYVIEANATEAGAAYRWIAQTIAVPGNDADAAIDRLAAREAPGTGGVLAYLGPRAGDMRDLGPRWGGLLFPVPLTAAPATPAKLFRAALENFAFAVRANLDLLREITGSSPAAMHFGGGMARGATLSRILADVTATAVLRYHRHEVTALGAAMCAAVGAGAYADLASAVAAMTPRPARLRPDPLRSLEYRDLYQRWVATGQGLDTVRDTL